MVARQLDIRCGKILFLAMSLSSNVSKKKKVNAYEHMENY
jgi:hypothetical protein